MGKPQAHCSILTIGLQTQTVIHLPILSLRHTTHQPGLKLTPRQGSSRSRKGAYPLMRQRAATVAPEAFIKSKLLPMTARAERSQNCMCYMLPISNPFQQTSSHLRPSTTVKPLARSSICPSTLQMPMAIQGINILSPAVPTG